MFRKAFSYEGSASIPLILASPLGSDILANRRYSEPVIELYESLLINRKYGMSHTFKAPCKDLPKPYQDAELNAHLQDYAKEAEQMMRGYAKLDAVYGCSPLRQDPALMVFILGNTPLGLFSLAYQHDPQAVQAELLAMISRPIPPIQPASPTERLTLARFWNYTWSKHACLLGERISVMRELVGPNLLAVGNYHELPHLDQEALGRSLDYPAVAVCPLLLEDNVLLRHYTAYWVQQSVNHRRKRLRGLPTWPCRLPGRATGQRRTAPALGFPSPGRSASLGFWYHLRESTSGGAPSAAPARSIDPLHALALRAQIGLDLSLHQVLGALISLGPFPLPF